jgi:hypothetical protein
VKTKFHKIVTIVALIVALGVTTVPKPARADGLMPWGCDLAMEFGFQRFGWICFFQIMMEGNCCDPTGDSWLD